MCPCRWVLSGKALFLFHFLFLHVPRSLFSTETNVVGVPPFDYDSQLLRNLPTSLVVPHILMSRWIYSITFVGLKVKLMRWVFSCPPSSPSGWKILNLVITLQPSGPSWATRTWAFLQLLVVTWGSLTVTFTFPLQSQALLSSVFLSSCAFVPVGEVLLPSCWTSSPCTHILGNILLWWSWARALTAITSGLQWCFLDCLLMRRALTGAWGKISFESKHHCLAPLTSGALFLGILPRCLHRWNSLSWCPWQPLYSLLCCFPSKEEIFPLIVMQSWLPSLLSHKRHPLPWPQASSLAEPLS